MCYDNNAQPPLAPGANGDGQGADLILQSADGTQFSAYMACAAEPNGRQIVIYPDVRGLHNFYRELAKRFAEAGVDALAIDYFGRTAGIGVRGDDFDYMPHVQQMQVPQVFEDLQAALARLRAGRGRNWPTFVVGFCRGGSLGLLTAREDFGLTGAIVFYAGLARQLDGSSGTVLDLARDTKIPILGLFGGADQGIPAEQVQQLEQNLDHAGVEHELEIYEGAPHSFFDRKFAEYAGASTDAWNRTLDFIAGQEEGVKIEE